MTVEFKGPIGANPLNTDGATVDKDDPRVERLKRKRKAPDSNGHDTKPAEPIVFIAPNDDVLAPRDWHIDNYLPANHVSLLSGPGGIGKSVLAMQLGACTALNMVSDYDRDWLGLMPKGGPVGYVSCEEDKREAEHRIDDIAKHYGTKRSVILQNMHITSWVDFEQTQLMVIDKKSDSLVRTELYYRLEAALIAIKARLVILDTAADLFGGNEISRSHTRQFISMLRRLAITVGNSTTILLLTHPSLEGIRSGSGLSGSTAWHNSVRARAVLSKPPAPKKGDGSGTDEVPEYDGDVRILAWHKNNYGPAQDVQMVRWSTGVYVSEGSGTSLAQQLKQHNSEEMFMATIKARNDNTRYVSDKKGANYAPAIFASTPEAKAAKLSSRDFAAAMERLFKAGRIKVVETGPPSRRVRMIVPVDKSDPLGSDLVDRASGPTTD